MENPPFMDDFPIETSIHRGFSIAMFDCQRVYTNIPSGFVSGMCWGPGTSGTPGTKKGTHNAEQALYGLEE